MHLITRFRRWCHCMWYLIRPWRWRVNISGCRDVNEWFDGELVLLACVCGKVFYYSENHTIPLKDIPEYLRSGKSWFEFTPNHTEKGD